MVTDDQTATATGGGHTHILSTHTIRPKNRTLVSPLKLLILTSGRAHIPLLLICGAAQQLINLVLQFVDD